MTEREKVIKGLDCCLDVIRSRQFSSGCGFCPYVGAERCKIKMIEDAIALLKAQEPGWISVKDRMPERCGKYLVVSKTALAELPPHVKTALFLNNLRDNYQFEYDGEPNEPGFYNGDGEGDWVERYVTHWMPLPEPPKEG